LKNGLDGAVSMPLMPEVVQAHLCALREIVLPAAFPSSSIDAQVVPHTLSGPVILKGCQRSIIVTVVNKWFIAIGEGNCGSLPYPAAQNQKPYSQIIDISDLIHSAGELNSQ
jgi:hypothetical protein